ncbi:MAG: thiosulfate sulfurtransferase GlpE [Gammaproteobacteria bacterium]|nr:thiosulfate sulfurtransferase GlpE [Gammaproteobacteria bacterium]
MSEFKLIDPVDAFEKIKSGNVVVADIRDPQSFKAGHVEGAFMLNNSTMTEFSGITEFDTPVLVFCYHGHSSQGAAQYLANQGYEEVYSVNGGFEMWKQNFPFVSE